jgi:rod shape-determining protein MreD
MVDLRPSRVWIMRGAYLLLGLGIIFAHLLPLQTQAREWAAPDLLMELTFAWAVRRPEYVPALSVGAITLLSDLLLQRPPGLMAAMLVIGAEILRSRASANRDMPYALEWLTAAAAITTVLLATRLVHAVFFIPQSPLGLSMYQLLATIAIYPVIVIVSQVVMGVRRAAPGEVDALGHRL